MFQATSCWKHVGNMLLVNEEGFIFRPREAIKDYIQCEDNSSMYDRVHQTSLAVILDTLL